ncbi:MAG: C40 family peptidase [Deltaproteobacteria bacterium]|nr:C40 family peptidase [Deltaproteobacteria bacterium]
MLVLGLIALHMAGFAQVKSDLFVANSLNKCCRLRLAANTKLTPNIFLSPLWLSTNWRKSNMHVVQRDTPPTPDEIIELARDYLGTPYAWGGVDENGLDCSGLVNKVYAENGYDLPRTACEQFLIGEPTPVTELVAGDLVFFNPSPNAKSITHVGIYVGNGEMIHASSGKGEVTYDRLDLMYYRKRFAGARRILSLSPGIYSSPEGNAADADEQNASSLDALVSSALADDDALAANLSQDDSASQSRPRQLAQFQPPANAMHTGPVTLRKANTSFGLRLGTARLDDSAGILAVVESSYFGHDDALAIQLAAPFEAPFAGERRAHTDAGNTWDEPIDYSKIIQEIRYGQPGSDLYFELGRTTSGTLGNGASMHNFTPNLKSRMLPDYTLLPDALSLAFDADFSNFGVQSFVDDLMKARVLGASVFFRPFIIADSSSFLRTARLSAAYVVDIKAPYHSAQTFNPTTVSENNVLHALSVEAEISPINADRFWLSTYLSVASLSFLQKTGYGSSVGLLIRSALEEHGFHAVRLRGELSLSGASYIPSYFDAAYELDRKSIPRYEKDSYAISKLYLLDHFQANSPRQGIYLDAGYQVQRRFGLGVAYQDYGSFTVNDSHYASRNLFVYLDLRNLYLPASSKTLSLYFAYYRRGFVSLTPFLSKGSNSEYLFAAFSLQFSRYFSLGGAARRNLNGVSDTDFFDAVLDVTARYEL